MTDNLGQSPSTWQFTVDGLEETVPLDAVSLPGKGLVTVIGDYDGFVHDDLERSPAAGRHVPSVGTTRGLAFAAQRPDVLVRAGSEAYVSRDGGRNWSALGNPTPEPGGHVALSSDGEVLLMTQGRQVYRNAGLGDAWAPVAGLDFEASVAADSLDPTTFYAYDPGSGGFVVSVDGGQSFAPRSSLPVGGASRLAVAPGVSGQVWVAVGAGLMRTRDSGSTFERLPSVARCSAVGVGVPQSPELPAVVYIWGAVDEGPVGVYRSTDDGLTWLRINDDAHQYGGPGNGQLIVGDSNVYGRVFMSTAGRGLVYGQPVALP